jgi:hypothetical protein
MQRSIRFSEPMSVEKPPRNIHSSITQKTQNNNKWTISVWVAWNKASKYFNSLCALDQSDSSILLFLTVKRVLYHVLNKGLSAIFYYTKPRI